MANIIDHMFFLCIFNTEEYYIMGNISNLIYLIIIIKKLG